MIPSSLKVEAIAARLRDDFGYTPVLAAEIEFYIHPEPSLEELRTLCDAQGIGVFHIERERGRGQYEIALEMTRDVSDLVRQMEALKKSLAGRGADFSALPFADQPGSGLHIHVHLEDGFEECVYFKKDESISDALRWSVGGLLSTMRGHMDVFAPNDAARERLRRGGMAPSTLSWGANNRTTAIRLPDSGAPFRHIEHRVASADADAEAVIAAVLSGIHYGLSNRCDPGPQIYGDAALPVYALPKLVD